MTLQYTSHDEALATRKFIRDASSITVNGIAIPELPETEDNPTNLDVLKATFPDIEVEETNESIVTVWFGDRDRHEFFVGDGEWLNAPYKERKELC